MQIAHKSERKVPRASTSVAIEPNRPARNRGAGGPDRASRTRGDYRQGASPMKNHKLAGSICALLLTALGASSAAAQTSTSEILFARTVYRAYDNAHGSALYRINTSGTGLAQLVPVTYGNDIVNGSWSPSGAAVAYEVQQPGLFLQLYVVDRQGGAPHRITTGNLSRFTTRMRIRA